MPIINSRDLDARMGQSINPNSVPRHDGATLGAMEANIQAGSEHHHHGAHIAREGVQVYNMNELPGNERAGTTVISVRDAPPLMDQHDPATVAAQARLATVPVLPKAPPPKSQPVVQQAPLPPVPPAPLKAKPIAFPPLATMAPAPTIPAKPMDPNGPTAKLMASLGLLKPKK